MHILFCLVNSVNIKHESLRYVQHNLATFALLHFAR